MDNGCDICRGNGVREYAMANYPDYAELSLDSLGQLFVDIHFNLFDNGVNVTWSFPDMKYCPRCGREVVG